MVKLPESDPFYTIGPNGIHEYRVVISPGPLLVKAIELSEFLVACGALVEFPVLSTVFRHKNSCDNNILLREWRSRKETRVMKYPMKGQVMEGTAWAPYLYCVACDEVLWEPGLYNPELKPPVND